MFGFTNHDSIRIPEKSRSFIIEGLISTLVSIYGILILDFPMSGGVHMSKLENSSFSSHIQKIQLTSGNLAYGPRPGPDEEVEQRVTITRDGSVWLSRWAYGNGVSLKLISREQYKIAGPAVIQLFDRIERHFRTEPMAAMATDDDIWNLKLTNDNHEIFRYHGSVSIGMDTELDEISKCLRHTTGKPDLIAFNDMPEKRLNWDND